MKELFRLISEFFDFKYVMNKRTEETHDPDNIIINCGVHLMSDHNKKYITKRRFLKLHAKGEADGCRWCMKEYNHMDELSRR